MCRKWCPSTCPPLLHCGPDHREMLSKWTRAQTSADECRHFEMQRGQSSQPPPTPPSPPTHTHTRGKIMSAPLSPSDPSSLKEAGCQKLSGPGGQKCLGRSGLISPHVAFNTSPPERLGSFPLPRGSNLTAATHSWSKCAWERVILFLPEIKAWTGLICSLTFCVSSLSV